MFEYFLLTDNKSSIGNFFVPELMSDFCFTSWIEPAIHMDHPPNLQPFTPPLCGLVQNVLRDPDVLRDPASSHASFYTPLCIM